MISKDVIENKTTLEEKFNNSTDLVYFQFDTLGDSEALVVYINGLVDKQALNEFIIKPMMSELISPYDIKTSVYISEIKEISNIKEAVQSIIDGHVIIFLEGLEIGFVLNLCSYEKRAITESGVEQVIRGPRESFVEDIYVNKTLIRRKIRNSNLVFEDFIFGEQTNTQVSIVYMNGIVNEEILAELKARLKKIKTDSILDVGYIEQYIEDSPNALVRTAYHTEKPDVLAGKILEGRIGIMCDGSPDVLTVPKVFIEDLMSPEDYYLKPKFATFLRFVRFISFFISVFLVGSYIAVTNFHQEMIPTQLLISLAGQREGVPFPSLLEALMLVIAFEIIKEAGLRIPNNAGQTVTLVGGLVIGQAAVEAGLVSAIIVIIVSAAGIAEFVNPAFRVLIVIYRIMMIILGGFFGLFGIFAGLAIMTFHLISLKSFCVPYLYPIAPFDKEGMKDFLRRAPIKKMNYRPKYIADKDSRKRNK